MKTILRALALAIVVIAAITWGVTGANRGWTKTSVEVKAVDEVTGIEGITYREGFFPGLDFLGGAALGAAALVGVSFFIRNKKPATV